MKRILNTVSALLICGALLTPNVEARGRNNSGQSSPQRTHQPASRPGNMGRPSTPSKPQQPTKPQQHERPGNNHNKPGNNTNRPDNGHNRPNHGQNRPDYGHNKPNHGHNHPSHPGFGGHGGHRPDYHPNHSPGHNMHHGPMRPHMPPHYGWYRPAPPRGWRAPHYWRPFSTILGISLGSTINLSINALVSNGYAITSYGDNSVYVSNVPMLNMMWPDAVLYYNGVGGLCGSRFVYSTGFYDMNRYNLTYNSLVNAYGMPYSLQNTASGMEATWWGTNNQFIRLAFSADYSQNGSLRYFTTLSFGN